jgi:hypothetical protein
VGGFFGFWNAEKSRAAGVVADIRECGLDFASKPAVYVPFASP